MNHQYPDTFELPMPYPASRLCIAYAIINANQKEGTARAVVEVAERLAEDHEVHLYSRTAQEVNRSVIHWHRVPGIARPEAANFSTFLPLCTWMLRNREGKLVHSAGCNVAGADVYTIQNIQPAKMKLLERLSSKEAVSASRRISRWMHLRISSVAEKSFYSYRPGRRTPLFLPVSRGVEAELRTHYDIGPALVRVIPNAADTTKFNPLSMVECLSWRRANGVPEDATLLLFAGGEWGRKGLDLAVQALARLESKTAVLYVAGDDPDRGRFDVLGRELGIRDRVIFGGFRHDVARAMAAADLFLFPSWYEAFSLVTIEAAACGLPIVATRINGTEDFVQEGENGAFIEHEPEQIAQVLNRLLTDRARLRAMGQRARERVERSYTWDLVAQQTEEAYREYIAAAEPGLSMHAKLAATNGLPGNDQIIT